MKLPQALRAAETETGADTDTKITKVRVAKHELLKGTAVTENEEEATGIRYTQVGSGKTFELDVAGLPDGAKNMLAIFGAKTLATNEASQARNGKDADEAGQLLAIQERFDLIAGKTTGTPQWVDRTGAERKIDLDVMAQAMANVAGKQGKSGQAIETAFWRAKLDAEDFVRKVRNVTEFKNEYAALQGRQVATVDDVFSSIGA
jgi:predicted RNA-binding protein YlqC (UPF0109 family)